MYLDKIVVTKKEEVRQLATTLSIQKAKEDIAMLAPTRGFHEALTSKRKRQLGLIAEVKKASPSKGLIREDFDPVQLAQSYAKAGADCLSVLTDEVYFQGSKQYLSEIRENVSLPLLRKDFIIDELQIYEARLIGADAILLIAAILSDEELAQFTQLAHSLSLDVLLEVHDEAEMKRAIDLGTAKLIGINNRNLHTFETSLTHTENLAALVPEGTTLISESGIKTVEDIAYLTQHGAHGVLIGETFMRQANIEEAVNHLMGPIKIF